METEKLKELDKVELIDMAMQKMVAGGSCENACSEWVEHCGGDNWDDCGQNWDICTFSEINSR